MTMTREELIQSLPFWLRERADELLWPNAYDLDCMTLWDSTNEEYEFWYMCSQKRFDDAIEHLRVRKPEVYQKYYAKYFIEHDSVSITEIKEELNSIGSCAIVVCLALHEAGVPLPKEAENNIAVIKHRYEEVESKLKNL